VVEAVRHMRQITGDVRRLQGCDGTELATAAKNHQAPLDLVRWVAENGRLPVVNFSAGGIATPADAALMMQLGAEAVFVGSGIFEVGLDQKPDEQRREQLRMGQAIVKAVANWNRPEVLAEVSEDLPKPMRGLSMEAIPDEQQLAKRGW